jgi:hypothetical protein
MPASLGAGLLEMRCLEPPGVNPLQPIQQSAAQQDAARNARGHLVGDYSGTKPGQAFQPDRVAPSGWKA